MNPWFWMPVWVVCMVVGVACVAVPASAAEWVAAYTAEFRNEKDVSDHWWTRSSKAEIADGKLVLTPGGRRGRLGTYLYSHKFPGSVRVEAVLSVPPNIRSRDINFELLLHADVPVGTYERRGYEFQFRSRGSSCRLRRGRRTLKSASGESFRLASDKTYHILAERDDGQISLSIDGKQILSVTDDSPLESPVMNLVGLTGSRCTLRVEKFVVSVRKDRPKDVIDLTVVPAGPRITVTGPAMCARGYAAKHGLFDGCPHLAIYALDGTPGIKAKFDRIMDRFYPEKGLDVDEAVKLLEKFDEHLKYYIVPGPLANKDHTEHDYPSRILSVTGTFFERHR